MSPKIIIVGHGARLDGPIQLSLESHLLAETRIFATADEAAASLEDRREDVFLVLLDVDTAGDDAVARMLAYEVPLILLLKDYVEKDVLRWMGRGVVDCVDPSLPTGEDYLRRMIRRLWSNHRSKVLVVEDSMTYREIIGSYLEANRFEVLFANTGEEGLELVDANPEIRLAIVDHILPGMDGFTLVTRLRQRFSKERMAIIGMSGSNKEGLGVSFLKFGADDFMDKPIKPDQLFARTNETLHKQDMLRELKFRATTDFLTKLCNRSHFFETAQALYANARRGHVTLAAAMIDVDFFKKVNDTHGHAAGDEVLRSVAKLLRERVRDSDLVARLGGEEFCYLAVNPDPASVASLFEGIRKRVEALEIRYGDVEIGVTVSIGVCTEVGTSIDDMLNRADKALYDAKEGGRNRVVIAE